MHPPVRLLAFIALTMPASAADQGRLAPINCLIEPLEIVRLSTPVEGMVAEVLVERGDNVRAGDIVARLDTTLEDLALELAEARASSDVRKRSLEARLAFLEAQAERNEQLAARNAVPQIVATEARLEAELARQELDEVELARSLAVIEARQARALRDQKILRAPVSGIVAERLIAPGEFRDTQSHFATIARIDVLRVEAFAPLSYAPHLALGQEVTIRPEAPVGGSYTATITIIDRVFDAATATFGIRMALDNADLALPAGLRCEVEF